MDNITKVEAKIIHGMTHGAEVYTPNGLKEYHLNTIGQLNDQKPNYQRLAFSSLSEALKYQQAAYGCEMQ